jgi:gamma-glutamyltranspeptidase/glutathione hydrolase
MGRDGRLGSQPVSGVAEGWHVAPGRGAPSFTSRPLYYGRHGLVAAGHYLAAAAGARAYALGGNAADAAAAAGFCLTVVLPQSNGIGGECPTLVYDPKRGGVTAISGQGTAPGLATVAWFRNQGISLIPGDGLLPATVPASFGVWITLLQQFGRLGLAETLGPAVELAEGGFPVYPGLASAIASSATRFREWWPSSTEQFMPNGRVPAVGEVLRQPAWAATFKQALDLEVRERDRGREAALEAVRRWFYRGPVAEAIGAFAENTTVEGATGRYKGLIRASDLAAYETRLEAPVSYRYRGIDVYKCGPWTQGPVFLQQLAILQRFDLAALGHNSPEYIHTVTEAAKLAFADREAYYGDPAFTKVPLDELLSDGYATRRAALIEQTASAEVRPGDLPSRLATAGPAPDPRVYRGDTTHVDAVDESGLMVSATPSGGWFPSSPVVPGLGFPLGTRGQMFVLQEGHPNALEPGKRPRATLTPSLALRDAQPWLAFGTPGGDQQDQWTLHFFLNVVDFGMDLQSAIEAPSFHTLHLRNSFYPRELQPKRVVVESRLDEETIAELRRRGHDVQISGPWSHGQVTAIGWDGASGVLAGAASPRAQTAYVAGN